MIKFLKIRKKDDYKKVYNCQNPTMSVNGYLDLLQNNKFKNSKYNWGIWFPDGYNNIDEQMKKLKISNEKQIIFSIPNCDKMVSKYNLWKSLVDYYGREKAKWISPETFLLDKDDDIKEIKSYSDEYKFILKRKKQRKEGLKIINGTKSVKKSKDEEKDYLIAQKLIKPFTVNERKINLRIYIMLTMKNNRLSIYFSEYGTCIYTNKKYDEKSNDFSSNITSYKLDLNVYDKNPLTFNQLKTHMRDNNVDHETLFEKIKHKILLFVDSVKDQIGDDKFKNNLCAQVFGLDFIIGEDLEPYLLECNKGPEMKPKIVKIETPKLNNDIKKEIKNLKESLDSDISFEETIKQIKNSYKEIYKGYPKTLNNSEILIKIEKFLKNDKKLNSYPSGYISGNGIKVQKDALEIIGLIKDNNNNGFEKIN